MRLLEENSHVIDTLCMCLEQSALVEAVPAHDRGLELDELYAPFQRKPVWDLVNLYYVLYLCTT